MDFEIHSHCHPGSVLHEAWSSLAKSPLEHPGWLMTWWDAFSDAKPNRELYLVSVYDNGRLVGVAPLFTEHRTLRLLGSGRICTDHQQLLIGNDDEAATLELIDWLLEAPVEWQLLELECIDDNSRLATTLNDVELTDSTLLQIGPDTGNCSVGLPATWDEYLALLSKNHRKRCRKWNRQYFESGEIKMHSTLQQWDHDSAFATLVELHSQRRNAVGEQSFFDCPRQSQFLRAAFDALSKEGLVEISGIELHGEMIAVEFELLGNDTVYAYQSGIRESAKEYSPGSLSLLWRIRHAIESGKTTFDFMRGTEEYKSHWKAKTNTTSLIHLRPRSRMGRLGHTSSQIITHSLNVVRSLVGK